MSTFTVREQTYKAGRIPAVKQFHILRRIAPVVSGLKPDMASNPEAAFGPLADVLAGMPDEQADYILFGLLEHAQRQMPEGMGFAPVVINRVINHIDITMPDMMLIAWHVLRENMGDFLAALPQILPSADRPQSTQ